MKSLMLLMESLLADCSRQCCVSTNRDWKTISMRTKNEGLSFLTITLPNFCKDFERSLDQGFLSDDSFLGFKKRGGLPVFLQGFLSLIFDRANGQLLREPSIAAIISIRQLCLAFKKFRAPCSKRRVRDALENYVITDLDVAHFDATVPEYRLTEFKDAFGYLFSPVLKSLERKLRADPNVCVPKHGPGTTADRTVANDKFNYLFWTERLEQFFSLDNFLLPNESFDERRKAVSLLSPRNEPPVRVITVPKTLKTPRIIAVEPVHMQYVQQGLLELLIPCLEHPKMFDSLGFSDQGPNRLLAMEGSKNGNFATLDLSEASDRVSNLLVLEGLSHWPTLSAMVQACRSRRADVPGFGCITLSKFASMGSALCFPIEAMVFLTITFLGMHGAKAGCWRGKLRQEFLSSVRVYGDDIIVPVNYAQSVARELSHFSMKVNERKSFWTGKFRESCGGDYYDGIEVKPSYIKTALPASLRHVDDFISSAATRNLLYKDGYWETAKLIDRHMETFAPFPVVGESSVVLGRHSYLGIPDYKKLCPNLHRPIVKGVVPRREKPISVLDGPGALMKFFLKRGNQPIFSKEHLKRDGRPKNAALHLRWASCV